MRYGNQRIGLRRFNPWSLGHGLMGGMAGATELELEKPRPLSQKTRKKDGAPKISLFHSSTLLFYFSSPTRWFQAALK
jgi:hypothetical protein